MGTLLYIFLIVIVVAIISSKATSPKSKAIDVVGKLATGAGEVLRDGGLLLKEKAVTAQVQKIDLGIDCISSYDPNHRLLSFFSSHPMNNLPFLKEKMTQDQLRAGEDQNLRLKKAVVSNDELFKLCKEIGVRKLLIKGCMRVKNKQNITIWERVGFYEVGEYDFKEILED